MKFILEAWLSPSRKEVYDAKWAILGIPNNTHVDEEISDNYLNGFYPDNIFDLFEEYEQDGLWKVVVNGDFRYHTDYWGDVDIEWDIEVIYKGKCPNFSSLRYNWDCLRPTDLLED